MYVPPHINPRVIVQHSILTLHNSPEEAWETDDLIKYEIDGDSFFEIRKNLDYIGFNESSLFPDLDGISRHLSWKFDLEFHAYPLSSA